MGQAGLPSSWERNGAMGVGSWQLKGIAQSGLQGAIHAFSQPNQRTIFSEMI
jgi:hypothetical protein